MPMQPGPFRQGTQADVTLTPDVYDFTDDGLFLSAQLQSIASGWDSFILDLGDLANDPPDPTFGFNYGSLLAALSSQQQIASFPSLDSLITASQTGNVLLTIATSFAPAAAWTDPTAPFVPPDPTQTIVVPEIPIGSFNPTINGTVSGGGVASTATVTLSNLTRVGSKNFVVGDSFLITVVAGPDQEISVDGYFNGATLPYLLLASTDSAGQYALSAIMSPENAGAWIENYYVQGQLIVTFSFIVSPAT